MTYRRVIQLTLLQRQKFTRSFALEAVRQNLVWRLTELRPALEEPSLGLLHCLPADVCDPFGRPIIVLKISGLKDTGGSDNFKRLLIPMMDRLQRHLRELNSDDKKENRPILQYVILLDLEDVSMQDVVRGHYIFLTTTKTGV